MNKSKYFTSVVVMMVIILIVGNWVMPVQANTTGIGTPVPTGTPLVTPNTPGNVVSAEQQEELKSAIQSYFEIRYRALSVLYSDDFKKNGFGNLISEGADAKTFLSAELGKLAVEIKRAELNHLRYVKYKYSLDIRNIFIDAQTQSATVSLIEEHDVIDEISMELSPENPFVSHSYNLEHTILLHKEQGQWKIVSDEYLDYLWRVLRQAGKSTDYWVHNMKAAPRSTVRSENETANINALLEDASSHAYDRDGAVDYANGHANEYNPNYPRYDIGDDALPWGDCINFVSQALYEGGNVSMEIPSPLPPPSDAGNGEEGWYLLNGMQRGRYWNDVGAFYNFVTQSYEFWHEGPEGSDVPYLNDIMLGDVIVYDWTGNGTWDHAVIVVDKVGTDIFVASHTPDGTGHYTAFFPLSYDPNLTQMKFIHIEQSDGHPPVKTEITARADDWGPNLYDNCTPPTLTTNNEIYFGACPSNGNPITSGFRFNNIQIPRGADLKYAYITFTVDGPYYWNTAPISVNIYEQTNSLTTVTWNIDGAVSQDYDNWIWRGKRTTSDLQTILEPIIGAGSWNSGQSLSIMFMNNGSGNARRVMAIDRKLGTFYPPDPSLANYWTARLIAAYSAVDVTSPVINSITRASASPTNASNIDFTVVFSESVTGVDASDFILTTSGVSGASITSVSGSGDTYTATVNTGSGDGTIRLDVSNSNTITDLASNPLDGGYTGGETYGVDKTIPVVLSSARVSASPTANANVDFTVTFSEPVTGVDTVAPFDDFSLSTTGTVIGATVTSITPTSPAVYTVRVNTGSGDGTIRLNVISGGSIMDSAHNTFATDFLTGEAYTIKKTLTVQSVGTYDGWVLESTETSGVGGTMNSAATTVNLGDDASNRQYVGILHFDTSSLPDTAVVTSATLKIKKYSLTGTNPFTILGNLLVDMRKPSFGAVDLAVGDFQAAAGRVAVAVFGTPVNNWYSAVLNSSGRNYINLTGTTQFRLRFTTDDNNNGVADYMKFYSGDHGNVGVWPTFVIEYYVP
ncbi:MAG: hypothetical protein HND45_04665 [Chloroflexi bacterium]|nr:hypothetical protein [Chloroflexota bacterium]MBW7919817.1 amidase domain-containing protein [Anaerolineales bacterium]MCZ2287932.1 amidase domain-containing protein [Anaerolineales bacterium]NOG75172.1 hypothetical protein [Chloroflexota bacterium]